MKNGKIKGFFKWLGRIVYEEEILAATLFSRHTNPMRDERGDDDA